MTPEVAVHSLNGSTGRDVPTIALEPDGAPVWPHRDSGGASPGNVNSLCDHREIADRAVAPAVQQSPDIAAATHAARAFLNALGVDVQKESMGRTPYRMAMAYLDFFSPAPFELRTFDNDGMYNGLVTVREIPLQSMCEHHLLPFFGSAHIGYLPGERIVGLSKLARTVQSMARRPQVQERLSEEIAAWLQERLGARGVGVYITAEHTCMTMRGAAAQGAKTITQSFTGLLAEQGPERLEFLRQCG